MDLDAVTDELYGLPPEDFTAVRDRRAQEARESGDRELSGRIRGLRRPTLAAWACNLLVRDRPEETRLLLELGEELRRAHRDLDGAQLRQLSAEQHRITARLARKAADLTARAGHRIGDDAQREVTGTLHAVLADPRAAGEWAAGRLDRPLPAPVGFAPDTAAPAPSRRPKATRTEKPAHRPAAEAPARDRGGAERARREQRKEADRARERARAAERELRAREKDHETAETEAHRADTRRQETEEEVARLTEQLDQARARQRQARTEARGAHDRLRRAERALTEARQQAERAAARAEDAGGGKPRSRE
ncbi:hypothetical protein [Streptomyces albus]|uniref:hypothetical protein n=1 Tax=Streptomyces albus TaxID=1888 RepID=UPI0034018C62